MEKLILSFCAIGVFIAGGKVGAEQTGAKRLSTAAEMRARAQWVKTHLTNAAKSGRGLPFSFVYHSRPSADLLGACSHRGSTIALDTNRKQRIDRWVDAKTGLEVRCVSVEYRDYPTVEWTVYLKNGGKSNTPIVEGIQGLDTAIRSSADGMFVLHGIAGDRCTADSYEPYQIALKPGAVERFSPAQSGKSCDGPKGWPYFNLQTPDGGAMIAVGWPGQWAASFTKSEKPEVRVVAGQALTHLSLKPGEEVRTPLIALLFWRGSDVARSQNLWRRWYMAHVMPRVHGQAQQPIAQIQVDGDATNTGYVQSFLDAGIKADICWRDAGGGTTWYPSAGGPYKGNDAWLNTGTWEVDPQRYPRGFRPYSDWVHAHNMQFLLWFEPERVGDSGSWLGKNHPEWMLPGTSHGALFNLGDPAALQWLIDHIDGMIRSQGIDWYREDMNGGGPLPAWRRNDAPDRQGATENHYVQGHLAFWDALRQRNVELRIDSCASGGRRNDLESMRRAVPLLRSDFQFPDMPDVVIGNQCHTYGLSSWLPFQGTGCYLYDLYSLRSFYLPGFGMGGLSRENVAMQRQAYAECAQIAPCMLGDYYPLTPYSRQPDQWIAWQFDRPEQGDGVIQAFRRDHCDVAAQLLRLHGLDPTALYEITNFDVSGTVRMSGKKLMETGLTVTLNEKPGAALLSYKRTAVPRVLRNRQQSGTDHVGQTASVDARSLRGKVMCGYQGWFRCPSDAAGLGWIHWSRDSRQITPATLTFEMWPEMRGYSPQEQYAAPGFTYPDGRPATLYSAENFATVRRHFDWMRDYGIDGAWLQQFVVDLPSGPNANRYPSRRRVLEHVRRAATQTGRVWALSYDIAGMPTDRIYDALTADWKQMIDQGVFRDAHYLHEKGLPVVQIWGLYYGNAHNAMTAALANRLVDFFKTPGRYAAFVVGGGDWNWRSNPDPEWQKVYRRFDAYCPWNVGNYSVDNAGIKHASTGYWAEDKRDCDARSELWIPVVYPGFSWDNLTQKPAGTSLIARRGGEFLWEQFVALAKLHVTGAYVAMFDEVDEGTAIFKVTSEPPTQAHFVSYEGLPSDWYLRLVGAGAQMLHSNRPVTDAIPIKP